MKTRDELMNTLMLQPLNAFIVMAQTSGHAIDRYQLKIIKNLINFLFSFTICATKIGNTQSD